MTLARELGSTRSKAIANRILEAVTMNRGISFATQKIAKIRTSQLDFGKPDAYPR